MVGRYENLFIFVWKAIKIAGSAQETGSVGLAETQVFIFRPQLAGGREAHVYASRYMFSFPSLLRDCDCVTPWTFNLTKILVPSVQTFHDLSIQNK